MHKSAMDNGQDFFTTYGKYIQKDEVPKLVDVGAFDVNGSLREICPAGWNYVGVDASAGKGVDLVLEEPYQLPFDDNSVDVVVSSSCFEHSEMFWLSFMEILRILKPGGLFYLNAPSGGDYHRYPVDCWRFYPDSGKALERWARRSGVNALLLESFTQVGGQWHDYVAVFIKDAARADQVTDRMLHHRQDFENGVLAGSDEILNFQNMTQSDRRAEDTLQRRLRNLRRKWKRNWRKAKGYLWRAG